MTFVIDIDGTLFNTNTHNCGGCARKIYGEIFKNEIEIDLLNKLFKAGHKIILYTGRNWDSEELTRQQLEECGIKYHNLVMGKPQGDYYIDEQSRRSLFNVPNIDIEKVII